MVSSGTLCINFHKIYQFFEIRKISVFFSNQIKNQLLQDRFESPILKPLLFNKIISLRFINIGLITLSIELLNKKNFLKLPDTPNLKTQYILHQTSPNPYTLVSSEFVIIKLRLFIIYLHYVKQFFVFELGTNRLNHFYKPVKRAHFEKKSLNNNKFCRFPYTQSFLS